MIYFLSRRRFDSAWYYYWDHYHACCVFSIWSLSGLLLGSRWAADSPPDEVSVYMRVITHARMYLLVIIFVTYGLRGLALAIIIVLVTQ